MGKSHRPSREDTQTTRLKLTTMSNKVPTQQEVRAARHAGFKDSITRHNGEKQKALYDRYAVQDARREKNISGLVTQLRGVN